VVAANFFNTFVNPIALGTIGWKYYFVFIVVLVAMGIVVYYFYPETRGYSLEQMAVIFDGEEEVEVGRVGRVDGGKGVGGVADGKDGCSSMTVFEEGI
jgi:H+/Cl- antiporter ClcA